MTTKRLWIVLALIMATSFAVLGMMGREINRQAPPIPAQVVDTTGAVLLTREDIQTGQLAWQSMGGQQVGSVWGHGGYVAPDWSADQLHREITALLEMWSQREHGLSYISLDEERQAALKARVKREMRTNTYDPATGNITVSTDRAAAMREVRAHYVALFSDDPALESLREQYAVANNAVPDIDRRNQIASFYWWASWGAGTQRPNDTITYTSNWPHEPLIDNVPTPANIVWSVASVLLLIIGVAALIFWHARQPK
ncbi:MAG: nitric-oxide reductase large subunit, partial [Brevundimonas sp.]